METYSIYKITNNINNKIYIGQAKDYLQRWRQHKVESKKDSPRMIINQAMKKYGLDNFSFEVIASCNSCESANEIEALLIFQHGSHVSVGKGYNVSAGGNNAPKTEEWKKKISEKLMGHSVSPETLQKMIDSHKGHVPWNKGIPLSKEHAEALRNCRKGKPSWNKGVPCSEDQKLKLRKLSPDQELEIINDTRSSRVLAQEYKVNKSTIVDIRKRYKENGNCHI